MYLRKYLREKSAVSSARGKYLWYYFKLSMRSAEMLWGSPNLSSHSFARVHKISNKVPEIMLLVCSFFFYFPFFPTAMGPPSAPIQAGEKLPIGADNLGSGTFYKGGSFKLG